MLISLLMCRFNVTGRCPVVGVGDKPTDRQTDQCLIHFMNIPINSQELDICIPSLFYYVSISNHF